MYLLAYGRIYANKGAMTPGVTRETVDGMSIRKIERIITAMRHERYRFRPIRRTHIPKKNGKTRPLGMPSWPDKLVGEGVRPYGLRDPGLPDDPANDPTSAMPVNTPSWSDVLSCRGWCAVPQPEQFCPSVATTTTIRSCRGERVFLGCTGRWCLGEGGRARVQAAGLKRGPALELPHA